MADGSVIIDVSANISKAEKDLAQLNKKVQSLRAELEKKTATRDAAFANLEQAKADAAQAEQHVKYLQQRLDSLSGEKGSDAFKEAKTDLAEAVAISKRLNNETASLENKYRAAEQAVDMTTQALERTELNAANLTKDLARAKTEAEGMSALGPIIDKAGSAMDRFSKRVGGLVKRAFVFTLITRALRALRTWLGGVVKENAQAAAAMAQLKGALLTLAQPLLDIIIPAFIALVQVLTRVVSAVAQLFAYLTGKSIQTTKAAAKAMGGEAKAISSAGKAAEKASKSLASFDEINQLTGDNASGAGGAGGGAGGSAGPDFDFEANMDEGRLKGILTLVELIGAALAAWKIGGALGLDLAHTLALFVGIYEALEYIRDLFTILKEGANATNVKNAFMDLGLAAIFLGLALGPVAAGLTLVIGALAGLATAFADASKNGWNAHNTMLAIGMLLAGGLGIAILTGSWVPLLIAGLASIGLKFAILSGHGDELIAHLKAAFGGFVDFFKKLIRGDLEGAIQSMRDAFSHLKEFLFLIVEGIRDAWNDFLNWLNEKTEGKISGLIEFVRARGNATIDWIKAFIGEAIDFITTELEGIIMFITGVFTKDWDRAWDGVKLIVKGFVNAFIGFFEAGFNWIYDRLNALIEGFNGLAGKIPGVSENLISFRFEHIKLPRLAQGAVIPPNREFMAVLGDQRSGTNIETPLETMIQAFRAALQDSGGGGVIENVVMLDGEVIYRNQQRVAKRHGRNLVTSKGGA